MSSRGAEILLAIDRKARESLQAQIERQVRDAVRSGVLRPGSEVPSTRDLARDLGVSRPLVMEAYAQLAAEGYLALRQGAAPRVSDFSGRAPAGELPPPLPVQEPVRYDFRTGVPDLASFPTDRWLRASAVALKQMTAHDFSYTERSGSTQLRQTLADYLGRVRGVSADPRQILITAGFEQARSFIAGVLWDQGVRRIAVENPGYMDRRVFTDRGFELLPVAVDDDGIDVEQLAGTDAGAVLLTPAHQYPTGVVMSGARRLQLAAWLRDKNAVAVEDDYDGEFRYDKAPVGALQGLCPEQVIYAGTASKTLAPALRLGWLVVPPALIEPLEAAMFSFDYGRPRFDQHTLAEFIRSGDFDRHLRRMRAIYRDRREALLEALATELPEAEVSGISAGLHATVRLKERLDEPTVLERAKARGVGFNFLSRHYFGADPGPSTMLLSYALMSESAIRTGIRGLVAALSS